MGRKENISKLFEDNISNIYEKEEDEELTKEIVKYENLLLKWLSKEQKELLNTINELKGKRRNDLDKRIFIYGYSLSNKLMIESLEKE